MQENNWNSPQQLADSSQQIAYFQELKVFEMQYINQLCDELCQFVKDTTRGELMVCGSVAKIFSGMYSEDYTPKDIDFLVTPWVFRLLNERLRKFQNPNIITIEYRPCRYIVYTSDVAIEIWKGPFRYPLTIEKFKNKITYTKYLKDYVEHKNS